MPELQTPEAVMMFLGTKTPLLILNDGERNILNRVTGRDAYELACTLAAGKPYLQKLVDEQWANVCLENANERRSFHLNELKQMFEEAPPGSLAQVRIIELLRKERFPD